MSTHLSPDRVNEIKKLGATMTPKEVANKLHIPYATVHRYLNKKGRYKRLNRSLHDSAARSRREKVPADCFNVHQRENWLV